VRSSDGRRQTGLTVSRCRRSGRNTHFAESTAREFASFVFINPKDNVPVQLQSGLSRRAELFVNTAFQPAVKLILRVTIQVNVSSFLHDISSGRGNNQSKKSPGLQDWAHFANLHARSMFGTAPTKSPAFAGKYECDTEQHEIRISINLIPNAVRRGY
jgi:hypothetical protein